MSAALSAKKSTEETVRRVRRSIGPYEIECEIGRGSCGTVFLGRELESGRVAALKTLSPKLGAARERLEVYRHCLLGRDHESGVCSHPGIVAVYDVIGHDLDIRDAEGGRGRVSIAMEYVEGTDLAARLADPEPLPFEFIARVVREVAAALDHVHALGVVHRDIKPSNILVASDHSVRVTDFGIASLSGEDLSDDLERLGSPNYLAPERVLGLETDHRVDVYALGAVLYEMLTRQPPFSGDSVAELLRNIAAGTLLPVSRLRSREDRELDGIVSMALARDPEHRFQTAGELAAALNRYVDKQAERSHTVPTPLLGELTDLEDDLLADAVVLNGDGSRGQIIETEPPAVESRADAGAPVARSGSRVGWVLLPVLFGLAVAAGLYFLPRPDGSARSAQQDSVTAVPPDSKYLSLLEESRQLYVGGEPEAAAKMLRRAEKLSPDRSRIQQMRETARAEVASERAALREAEVLDRLETARDLMGRDRFLEARRELAQALQLAPSHGEAKLLGAEIDREQERLTTRRVSVVEVERSEPRHEEDLVEFSPPAVITSEPMALPAHADLRVDFYSQSPRGVLTVYVNGTQVVNRQFRFVEKKSLLRRRGRSGGFDERVRLSAGELSVRVYLSLPGRPAQMETLAGNLPGGSLRTLRARVDSAGTLAVQLH